MKKIAKFSLVCAALLALSVPVLAHHSAAAYDTQAKKLAEMFRKNFEKFGDVANSIRSAGPKG